MNIIETRTVGNIILNKETPKRANMVEHFMIPYYQRGYRWDNINVKALLNDIDNFINSKEENYCLQPIVVVPNIDNEGHRIWEVVDGQQRLTTLYIIFKYLNKSSFKIKFGQRVRSTQFLEELSDRSYNHEEPDFHYMSEAYRIVKEWFEGKSMYDVSYQDTFYSKITREVKVIWYQVEELDSIIVRNEALSLEDLKIDVFNRLNIGKIPLTDAELIRALLLSKIKLGLSSREAIMRQSEVSNEWDSIDKTLKEDDFWSFLTSTSIDKYSSHIEFIFRLMVPDDTKKYSTYLWFEQEIKNETIDGERANVERLWSKVKEYFAKFSYWYSERTLYHYIGYLNSLSKNLNEETLKEIIKASTVKKSEFKQWLEKEIRHTVKDIDLDKLEYGNKYLIRLFLLLNILEVEKSQSYNANKFPFHLYKNYKTWSIEHIHAQNSELMKDEKSIRRWVDDTLEVIENIDNIDRVDNIRVVEVEKSLGHYVEELKQISIENKINISRFNIVKNKIVLYFESESIHQLDNLALLSTSHNSTLNNSIFPVKRNKILDLDNQGEFIPPITRNVFLKYYSKDDLQPYYWSKRDKQYYYDYLTTMFNEFLN